MGLSGKEILGPYSFVSLLPNRGNEQSFHLIPGPLGLSQKFQARLYARVMRKAPDIDPLSEFFPTVGFFQVFKDVGELYTVEGIIGLVWWGGGRFHYSRILMFE